MTRGRTVARDLRTLLAPAWWSMRARQRQLAGGAAARLTLGVVATLAFVGVAFGGVSRFLGAFRVVPELSLLLAGKLLALSLLGVCTYLVVANLIGALSTFFLARDLDLLAAAPLDWRAVYLGRLTACVATSSWIPLLVLAPVVAAYGAAYHGGWWFPLVAIGILVPCFVIPAVLGAALAVVLVAVIPAGRLRARLQLTAGFAAAAMVVGARMLRPEQLVGAGAPHSIAAVLVTLRAPTAPWLPSEWARAALLGWLEYDAVWRPVLLLWTAALASVGVGAVVHRRLYPRALDAARARGRRVASRGGRRRTVPGLPVTRREMLFKELRQLARDTTQWSQLLLLVALAVVCVLNVRYLPRSDAGAAFLLANVLPLLNLAVCGIVLASIAARILLPSVSVEGRTWWLLRASPLTMRDMLWAKFWAGTIPLLALSVAVVLATDLLLDVTPVMLVASLETAALLALALAALAVAFGAVYPRFDAAHAAELSTSFGGVVFMMTAIALIGAVLVLEAGPVYAYLGARAFGTPLAPADLAPGFAAAGALCVIATLLPLRIAIRHLETVER